MMPSVASESALPEGWTLARAREIEASAELLDPADHFVVVRGHPGAGDYDVLDPSVIVNFSGLCLCLVQSPWSPAEWWMGELDAEDGSIACWSAYGLDLGEAIRGL